MTRTVVDLITDVSGEPGPAAAESWAHKASNTQVVEFGEAYLDESASWTPPPSIDPSQDGLRPYIPLKIPDVSDPTFTRAGPRLRPTLVGLELGYRHLAEWSDPYGDAAGRTDGPRLLHAIKHLLVYCDSVALEDPLRGFFEALRAQRIYSLPGVREQLALYFRAISHLAPLITDGTLLLVQADPERPPAGLTVNQTEFDQFRFEAFNRSRRAHHRPGDDTTFQQVRAVEETIHMLVAAGATGAYNPYMTSPRGGRATLEAAIRILEDMAADQLDWARDALQRARVQWGDVDELQVLAGVELPNLWRLTLADITAIRTDSEIFRRWRLDILRPALSEAANNLRERQFVDRNSEIRRVLQHRLTLHRAKLDKEIEQNRRWGPILKEAGMKTFWAGFAPSSLLGSHLMP